MTLFDNQYVQQRQQKAEELRGLGHDPYTQHSARNTTAAAFLKAYAYVADTEARADSAATLTVAGRIRFLRHMGKAAFAKVQDGSATMQIYFSQNELGDAWFEQAKRLIEVGDIIEAEGFPFVTKTGELALHCRSLRVLTKAIHPLPEKYHGLTDIESRYRQRYVDLIMNPEVKEVFIMRSRITSLIRRFFERQGFLEVETPMLHPIAGGAAARPFVTHHNALDEDKYLRIAPELYLKRLIVGGFEAVFELNRNFRNEGMDHTHNPEFTMIEFYWAYHTAEDLMRLTEELLRHLLTTLELPLHLAYDDMRIDFMKPFRRVGYVESITTIGGVDATVLEQTQSMLAHMDAHAIERPKHPSWGECLAALFDAYVEPKLVDPTFITDFPVELSPLAKRKAENPMLTNRFELFIARREIANGFDELNDPVDQHGRFLTQVEEKNAGNDEACEMDEDFVEALAYGMPPTAGEGIGIDRLAMLLTHQHSIKDVLLFPAMRKATL